MLISRIFIIILIMVSLLQAITHKSFADPSFSIATHGKPELPPNFTHFPYVNPDAPKGGTVRLEAIGSFDNLNPFIIKGDAATGLGLIFDNLLVANRDEPSGSYGNLAEWVDISKDQKTIRFKLRDEARFHNGNAILAEDVVWTFNTLVEQGAPLYRFYYGDVSMVEAETSHIVRFSLNRPNPEMAMILGQLSILSKQDWQGRDFTKTTLTPYVSSGPYRIKRFEAGKYIEYERVKDYWGKDLPVNRGFYNFNIVRYDYYRDRTISREAFKARKLDIWRENSAKEWANAFEVEAVKRGDIQRDEFTHERVAQMQGFAFNLRRDIFKDARVREALSYVWDFEWVNRNLMYEAYKRIDSYFDNSELAAEGLPSPEELALLEPLRDSLPERVFTEAYSPPVSDGSGLDRNNLRKAAMLLKEAGWIVQDGKLTHQETGKLLEFELMLSSDSLVPHSQALVRGVERLGGAINLRIVDSAQYIERLRSHDFDMIVHGIAQSNSPGNEQREYWGAQSATIKGGRNVMGIQNPAIDQLIEQLIVADSRQSLINHVRALDRILQWSFLMIPHYYADTERLAWSSRIGFPERFSRMGADFTSWWIKP